MKRFLYWTSMVILWAVCLWGAYGIRETYRGTDLILAGRTAEAREVFTELTHVYPDLTVHLTLFHAAIPEGEPRKLEHNDLRWITVGEMDAYPFCPADETILQKLRELYGN